MNETEKIVIEKSNGGFATFFSGIWMIPWAGMTGTMLYGILFDNNGRTEDYLTILVPLLIVGFVVVRQFLWNLKGRDEITFFKSFIRLERKGSFLHRPVTELPYNQFFGFRLGDFSNTPFWMKIWGFGGNTIIARCGKYTRDIGQGLNKKQAETYIEKLNEKLKTCA